MPDFPPLENPDGENPNPGQGSAATRHIPEDNQTGDPLCVHGPGNCSSLGDAGKGGSKGSQIIEESSPGDLGGSFRDVNSLLLEREFLRENKDYNSLQGYNHRFRGHREAVKFNFVIQGVMTICSDLYQILRTPNTNLKTAEVTTVYPTDTEIASAQHIREQIRFKEWLLLKDIDVKWFE